MTRNGIVEQFDEDRLENLLIKGWIVCDEPQPITPVIPDPYDIFNTEKAYNQLGDIFFYKIVSESGMCAMISDLNRSKSFYSLYQFVLCNYWDGRDESVEPIIQGKISDDEWVAFMKVYSDQNIDLSKEQKRTDNIINNNNIPTGNTINDIFNII